MCVYMCVVCVMCIVSTCPWQPGALHRHASISSTALVCACGQAFTGRAHTDQAGVQKGAESDVLPPGLLCLPGHGGDDSLCGCLRTELRTPGGARVLLRRSAGGET